MPTDGMLEDENELDENEGEDEQLVVFSCVMWDLDDGKTAESEMSIELGSWANKQLLQSKAKAAQALATYEKNNLINKQIINK